MLTPAQWSDLRRQLLVRQDLAPETTRRTIADLRVLERHGLDLEEPQLEQYEAFIAHRKQAGARGTARLHYYKAVRRLLRARKITWQDLACPTVEEPDIELPPDAVVRRLLSYGQERNPSTAREALDHELARFSFQLGHYTAIRPPSEHVATRLDDFDATNGRLYVWSDKVDRGRTLQLEPWLADIVRTYINGPRARADRGLTKQLLLRADGKPWTCAQYRMWLSRHGKSVSPSYYNYLMRHWGLTQRLIQWSMKILPVKRWAGHRKLATTEKYLHVAEHLEHARVLREQFQPPAFLQEGGAKT